MRQIEVACWARRVGAVAAAIVCVGGCGGGSSAPDAAGAAGTAGGASGTAGTGGGNGGSGGASAAQSLVTGEDLPWAVAVDDAFVYWTTARAIRRIAKTGGSPTTLFTTDSGPDNLIIEDVNLYWRNAGGTHGIYLGPKSGGQATMLVGGQPSGFANDADFVYWIDAADRMLRRTSKAAGATPEALAGPDSFGSLLLDDQYLYWAQGMSWVRRLAKTGGSITDLRPADATGDQRVGSSTIDDAYLYFTTSTSTAQTSALHRVPKTGGAGDVLASDLDDADAIAVAGDSVYWVTRGDSGPGYLTRIPKTGGAPTMLASGLGLTLGIAVDAQYVYWTEGGDFGSSNGRVARLPR